MTTAEDRARVIVDLVTRDGFKAIDALAGTFGVTPQTIRRDVNGLCDRGLLRRRHGGVELPPTNQNIAYAARRVLNIQAKRSIARSVAAQIPDGASLFFGIGTTPEMCAHALADHRRLRVMTNNLNVAIAFTASRDCEVVVAGGKLRPRDRDVIHGDVSDFFDRFLVDFGIFGVGGVDEDGTLLDFDEDEVRARQALARNSRRRFLVLDHTKFGRAATVRGGHITEADAIFTDALPPQNITEPLARSGKKLVIAPTTGPQATFPPTPNKPKGDRSC